MRTNISKFKNLEKKDIRNLIDFFDANFKKAYKLLIEESINEKSDLNTIKIILSKLKLIEKFYLLNICVSLKEYQDFEFLINIFFEVEYQTFNSEISEEYKNKFIFLEKQIIKESRQKMPLFKKEISFKLFISDNLKNLEKLYKKLIYKQLQGLTLKKYYHLFYKLYHRLSKAIDIKIPYFEINMRKFKNNHRKEIENEIMSKFWKYAFKDLYEEFTNPENFELILAQMIFKDYFFDERKSLKIDVIAKNQFDSTFKRLDTVNKNWKKEFCMFVCAMYKLNYIIVKSNDEVIYFLSLIFNKYKGFSFSSLESMVFYDNKSEIEKWEKFVIKFIKPL